MTKKHNTADDEKKGQDAKNQPQSAVRKLPLECAVIPSMSLCLLFLGHREDALRGAWQDFLITLKVRRGRYRSRVRRLCDDSSYTLLIRRWQAFDDLIEFTVWNFIARKRRNILSPLFTPAITCWQIAHNFI